jgi:hypothetical protein
MNWHSDPQGRIWQGKEIIAVCASLEFALQLCLLHNGMLVMLRREWVPVRREGGWMVLTTRMQWPHVLFDWKPEHWPDDPFEALIDADEWAKARGR